MKKQDKSKSTGAAFIDFNAIIKNGGATLDGNGAAVSFSRGYQVSVKDCFILSADNLNAVIKAIKSVINRIKHERGKFCGIWCENDLIYIDISENIKNRQKALNVGKARKQKSVYGWAESACLYC